ncbi:helix-turn-helix domain-containing protein [Streptomyces apocyni]|uniref:helix-turn-helix domain-containing protein n=1 Tax=Streptomyces apocyni TaxID=2654677 RepID=UPI001E44F75B|nr:helix-turn-helix domain-containing protein [Streptomyces apocyni]
MHVRHRHTERFTVVGNHLAQNRDLSLVAVGLAVHIQSLPDGAHVGIKELVKRWPESELRIARALRELEDAGYLVRERARSARGRVVTRTTFYEHPAERCRAVVGGLGARSAVTAPEEAPVVAAEPVSDSPHWGDAVAVLGSLRRRDQRLLLTAPDVERLAVDACAWLERGVGPGELARAVTALLPVGEIPRPAGLLAFRLRQGLPAELPAEPGGGTTDPMQNCEECDRGFRGPSPGCCGECREAAA